MFKIYSGKRVFITGHTGFKGSWLSAWLQQLGAEVTGYSLAPETNSHFNMLNLQCHNHFKNINDESALNQAMESFRPDIVFHLAAQPLVRESYNDPVGTYETNVLGSLKVYRASLRAGAKALVSITTDKVYENLEWTYGYRECDRLGGYDPYSSSKACVEVMTDSFRRSYLKDQKMLLSTVRAGNVIGGGDWAAERIIPDLVRSVFNSKVVEIRNPQAIRPWQHVLEPLRGYLLIGERLLQGRSESAKAYNLGPKVSDNFTVGEICAHLKEQWDAVHFELKPSTSHVHEAGILKLDISLAQTELGWQPLLDLKSSLNLTIDWYKRNFSGKEVITYAQIGNYSKLIAGK